MEKLKEPAVVNIQNDDIYRSLFERRPEAIFLAMTDGTIIRANEAASRMFGYSEEEFKAIGRSGFLDFDDYRTREAISFRTARGFFYGEITGIRKNGEMFPVEATSSIFKLDNGEERAFTSFRDLTEKKRTEEKSRLERERYDLVAKATNDAIWDWDIVNGTLRWGEGYRTLFGYNNLEGHSTIDLWNEHVHPEDAGKVYATLMHTVYLTTALQWEEEYRYQKQNGSYAVVLDRGFIIRDEKGAPLRMIGAVLDLSERRQNEIILRQLNQQLQKRAAALMASNEELEQFAYIASHDLQEPLRMITSFLSQLEDKYKKVLDEKGLKYIWLARDGAIRMGKIMDDLLEYSRVGRQEYRFGKIDIADLVKASVQLNQRLVSEYKASIHWENLPEIMAARAPLLQVFNNLINNALKYHRQGLAPMINIRAAENEDSWQFSVADNGIGIDPEFFQRIFILFQRLHQKDEYSGTGIGLAICRKAIENHGGKIWVEAVPGKGSTFYFTIAKQI